MLGQGLGRVEFLLGLFWSQEGLLSGLSERRGLLCAYGF